MGSAHWCAHLTLQGSGGNCVARHSLGSFTYFLHTQAGGLGCLGQHGVYTDLPTRRLVPGQQAAACLPAWVQLGTRWLWHKRTWSSAVPSVKLSSVASFLMWMHLPKGEEKLKRKKSNPNRARPPPYPPPKKKNPTNPKPQPSTGVFKCLFAFSSCTAAEHVCKHGLCVWDCMGRALRS